MKRMMIERTITETIDAQPTEMTIHFDRFLKEEGNGINSVVIKFRGSDGKQFVKKHSPGDPAFDIVFEKINMGKIITDYIVAQFPEAAIVNLKEKPEKKEKTVEKIVKEQTEKKK